MTLVKKLLSSGFYFILATVSRILPKWDRAEVINVFPSINNYEIKLPINITGLKPSFSRSFISKINLPSFRILLLKNVYVLGAGVVFKNLRLFYPSLAWEEDYLAFRHGSILFKQWSKETSVVYGNVALVYNFWALDNYYHWMIDSLTRILILKKKYSNITLILPAHFPDYMKRSIEILDCTTYELVKPDQTIKVQKLLFPELTSKIEYQHPILIKELHDTFYKKLNLDQKKPNKLIYASRNRQSKRMIQNENELISLLAKYGFESVLFENMSFDDQVKLMSKTKIILSIHGANLTNILFLPPSSIVVELMNEDFNNLTYYNLSSVLNLKYYCVACNPYYDEVSNVNYITRNNASLKANLIEIEKILEQIITD